MLDAFCRTSTTRSAAPSGLLLARPEHAVHPVPTLGQSSLLRPDDARVCVRRPQHSPYRSGSIGSRYALGLVQCQIGIAWLTESTRWHCPRGVLLLPVADMHVRLSFNVIWKKGNASPLLQKLLAQVQALHSSHAE